MEKLEEKYTEVKRRLDLIEAQTPEDNVRYLINQINIDNITVSEKDRVLRILVLIQDSIKSLNLKLANVNKKKK